MCVCVCVCVFVWVGGCVRERPLDGEVSLAPRLEQQLETPGPDGVSETGCEHAVFKFEPSSEPLHISVK